MDLVKARERAKQKAEQEKRDAEARAAEDKFAPAQTASPAEGPAAASDTKKPAKKNKKKAKASEPAKTRAEAPVEFQAEPEEAMFMDTAFGEDLPPVDLDEDLDGDEVLGCPALDKGQDLVEVDEAGDMSWEVQKAPARPSAPSREEQPACEETPVAARKPEPAPVAPAPVAASPAPAAKPYDIDDPPAKSPAVTVDWEDVDADLVFAKGPDTEDDFYTLVTEDLYMREFGRQDEDREEQLELLSFRLAREVYAVRLTSIKQIIKLAPITTVPRAPEYVLGVLSLRGTVIPIFDLRRRLNLPRSEPTRSSRIVVVSEGPYTVGLIVDEVKQVVRIPASGVEAAPTVLAGVEADYIEGIGRAAEKMIILLALDKIMTPVGGGEKGIRTA